MSACLTRKRSHAEDDEEDLPHAKREPDQDGSEGAGKGAGGAGSSLTQADANTHTRDGAMLEQDEEFWFEDGTVILVACNTEFRVYRGVLAGLSSVLKDLFQAEHHPLRNVPLYSVPTFLCPIVRVSDTCDISFALVSLRGWAGSSIPVVQGSGTSRSNSQLTMYPDYRLYDEREPPYHEISAAIRLGAKYKVADLYSQSLEYLRRYFPSTFDEWIELEHYGPPGWHNSEEIGVVNLARTTGEHALLPAAFLACICAEHNSRAVCHGIAREDGSLERLSPDDVLVCFEGKTSLRIATIGAVMRTFQPTASPKCTRAAACGSALRDVLADLEESLHRLLGGNPFAGYEDFIGWDSLGVCSSCVTMVHERNLKERKDVWDQLPELLGIDVPGWDEEPLSSPS